MTKIRYIEAPTVKMPAEYYSLDAKTVFLAGGITGCSDWQKVMTDKILVDSEDIIVFNPRRAKLDVSDKSQSKIQVQWEFDFLKYANCISFWFTNEAIQPIALFELGVWSAMRFGPANESRKKIFIGIQPGYARDFDIRFQMQLSNPTVALEICDNLDELANKVIEHYARR